MPSDGSETSYQGETYGNGVGTWLQENRQDAADPLTSAPRIEDAGDPLATRFEEAPEGQLDELEPLPRREPPKASDPYRFSDPEKVAEPERKSEPRSFTDHTEPPAQRSEGTGWIAPDALPSNPSSIPTSLPTSLSPVTSPPEPTPMSADRAAVLRDIRDRARQGTDGSGTWAGHTGQQSIVREPEAPELPENAGNPGTTEEHDVDTAILRPVRDPYEPLERDAETPGGGL